MVFSHVLFAVSPVFTVLIFLGSLLRALMGQVTQCIAWVPVS